MLTFSIFSLYCKTLTMGNCFGCDYKRSLLNFPYQSSNHTCVLPPRSLLTSKHDRHNDCGVTVIFHKQPETMSNITTTTQVAAGVDLTHQIYK